jgi:hypothetical protein
MADNLGTLLQLDTGYVDAFPIYLDFTSAFANNLITNSAIHSIFYEAARVAQKTTIPGWARGQFRLMTIDPMKKGSWAPKWGLRPGEFLRVFYTPSISCFGVSGSGVTIKGYENILDLYDHFVTYINYPNVLPSNMWKTIGVITLHEVLHAMLPRTGKFGNLSLHHPFPNNLLYGPPYGVQIVADPVIAPIQNDGLAWNVERCRVNGLRVNPAGQEIPVTDGGRAAWPMQTV